RHIAGAASPGDIRIEDGFEAGGERVLDRLLVRGEEIDAQLGSVFYEVPPCMPVTFGELVEQLLEADLQPGHEDFSIAARDRDLFVEGQFEHLPDVGKHRLVLARPAAGIGRWTTLLPPLVHGWTTGADCGRFGGSGAVRSVGLRSERRALRGIGLFRIGLFRHVTPSPVSTQWTRLPRPGASPWRP